MKSIHLFYGINRNQEIYTRRGNKIRRYNAGFKRINRINRLMTKSYQYVSLIQIPGYIAYTKN